MLTKQSLTAAMVGEQKSDVSMRMRAMLIHLVGTAVIALLVFCLIRLLWYPDFYWRIAGGSDLFVLICVVDAVLGPVLTFAIFNPAKGLRRLRFDLIVILCLQLLALGYGLKTVAVARPLFLVYSVDRFNLVTASDVTEVELQQAELPQFQKLSWGKPRVIGTRAARTPDEKLQFIDSALSGRDRHLIPKTYIPFDRVRGELRERSLSLAALKEKGGREGKALIDVEKKFEANHPRRAYVPLIAMGDWVVLVDVDSGELLEVLAINAL